MDVVFGLRAPRHRKISTHHRPGRAFVHWDVRADVVEDAQRVLGAQLHRDIAVHRGCRHQVEVWVQRRKHERDCIVRSRIDVKDELGRHRWCSSSAVGGLGRRSRDRISEAWFRFGLAPVPCAHVTDLAPRGRIVARRRASSGGPRRTPPVGLSSWLRRGVDIRNYTARYTPHLAMPAGGAHAESRSCLAGEDHRARCAPHLGDGWGALQGISIFTVAG